MLFDETQRFRQWWLWLTVLFPVAVAWYAFLQQIVLGAAFGDDPAPDALVWAFFVGAGLVLPVGFARIRLRTQVRPGEVELRFPPFRPRIVDLDEVTAVFATEYKPVANYGGWGYRRTLSGNVAFSVSGRHGVRLGLPEGRHLLIGTQRPDELVAAIQAARGQQI